MNKRLVKKLDIAFSRLIRQRDDQGGYFTCCSCGRKKLIDQADAGHFINRRWMSTRWREDNVHAQCRSCNRFNEGNAAGYALFMLRKYGEKHVMFLESLAHEPALYSDSVGELMLKQFKKELTKK